MADDPDAEQAGRDAASRAGIGETLPGPRRSNWARFDQPPPAAPPPGFEYAGFWVRLVAFLIDFVPLFILLPFLFAVVYSGLAAYGLWHLITAAYFVGFWTWRGQTPGKMLLGLRIARQRDGASPRLARSILRYVGYVISAFVFYLGFIWIAGDNMKQGWHDKIAGTIVVRRSR